MPRKLWWFFLSLAIGLSFAVPAHADDPLLEPFLELSAPPEENAEPVEVTRASDDPTEIKLSMPKGESYTVGPGAMSAEELANYRSLPESERVRFLKNRELMLWGFARALNSMRKPIGLGRKVAARWKGTSEDPEVQEARRLLATQTLREAGTDSVAKLLQTVDRQLWTHAPFFARVNELGASVETGFAGGAIVGNKGFFFIAGVGIALAVDPKQKALVAEVFVDYEPTKRAVPGYIGAEGFVSVFGNATYHDWKEPLRPEKGEGISLPGIAGCMTPNNARIGVAKGIGVGFPGVVALHSKLWRTPLFRVGISPQWAGGVRAKFLASNVLTAPFRWACNAALGMLGIR